MSFNSKSLSVLLAAAATVSFGAGSAMADTPPSQPTDTVVFNSSPNPIWVSNPSGASSGGWSAPTNGAGNYDIIAPGESHSYTAAQLQAMSHTGQHADEIWIYNHTNNSIDEFQASGYDPGTQSCNYDNEGDPDLVAQLGCLVQAPNIIAGETFPSQISVYASNAMQNDPHASATFDVSKMDDPELFGNFLTGISTIAPDFLKFTPDPVKPVSWGTGEQVMAGSPVWNCGNGEANEAVGGESEHEESTDVTTTVGFEQEVKLFDTVNSTITASVSVGHAWTDSTTDSQTISKDIDPNFVAWVTSIPNTQKVTGDVVMTGNASGPITFHNVTFSEPGRNASSNPSKNYQYVAHSRAMTQDEMNTYCTGGPTAQAHTGVVRGGSVPDITANADN